MKQEIIKKVEEFLKDLGETEEFPTIAVEQKGKSTLSLECADMSLDIEFRLTDLTKEIYSNIGDVEQSVSALLDDLTYLKESLLDSMK